MINMIVGVLWSLVVFLTAAVLFQVEASPALIRVTRQSTRCGQDGNNTQCLPDSVTDAPTSLVNCVANECVCNDCFMPDEDTGRCRLCPDYPYSSTSSICGVDSRPKQLTALLLSIFLSSTGAANFYIDQNGLGGGQLIILILTFVFSYAMCYLPCCLACCIAKDEFKGSCLFISVMIILSLLVVLVTLAMSVWWIADLIIFATNQRLSGMVVFCHQFEWTLIKVYGYNATS